MTQKGIHTIMTGPRWKKVFGDLWSNKARTILVVLSIFIGVFAVGAITGSNTILTRELQASYIATKPAHATIWVPSEDNLDDKMVAVIRHMEGVEEADARRSITMLVQVKPGEWKDFRIMAIPDYDDIRIDNIRLLRGAWPPPDKEVLIERSGLEGNVLLGADIGDPIVVERPDGKRRTLHIAGVVHDLSEFSTEMTNTFYAYGTMETIEWLSGERAYNQLTIRVAGDEHPPSREYVEQVADRVYEKIQKSGRNPSFPHIPTLEEHPLAESIGTLSLLMGALGVMSLFLSGFLVTNTISALMAQQLKQIGIMKAIGARASQIVVMYMILVFCFGVIALALSIPLAQLAINGYVSLMTGMLNFDLATTRIPTKTVVLQAIISIVIPMVAALVPVLMGTRITIREALSAEGGSVRYGESIIDRLVQRVRGLPRPLLLSLRNTFRRKARVVLTLTTLTIGGSVFIAIFSVQTSIMRTIDDVLNNLYNFDLIIMLEKSYRDDYVVREAQKVSGVKHIESWRQQNVRRVYEDEGESLNIVLNALPPDTTMMNPDIITGRWLLPKDQNAIVLSSGVLNKDPDIAVGDEIVLKINNEDIVWQVVGISKGFGPQREAYVHYDYYGRVVGEVSKTNQLRIQTSERNLEFQSAVGNMLKEYLKKRSIEVNSMALSAEIRQGNAAMFNFIVTALLVMAVLIAVVGVLGLAGTMSLNVIERTREIGIIRAIGASDGTVLQIFIVEGVMLGVISWLLGASLSLPISQLLSNAVGMAFFQSPLNFTFAPNGLIIWGIISIVLAAVASFVPAWNASRVTVRDVLAYE